MHIGSRRSSDRECIDTVNQAELRTLEELELGKTLIKG